MKIKRLLRGLILSVAVLITLSAIGLAAIPYILDSKTIRDKAIKHLSTWSDGNIHVSGPVKLKYFPNVSLTADKIEITKFNRLPSLEKIYAKQLHVDLNLWALVLGKIEIDLLELTAPNIMVKLTNHAMEHGAAKDYIFYAIKPLTSVLHQTSIDHLIFNKAIVRMTDTQGRQEILRNLDLNWYFSGTAKQVEGHGHFSWRKQDITYKFATGSIINTKSTDKFQLSYFLSTPLMSTNFSGIADLNENFDLVGKQDLEITDLRGFSSWLRYPLPKSKVLNTFSAKGDISWTGSQITFVNSSFKIDGNTANGTLVFDYKKPKPKLDATLAFQELDLAPYLPATQASMDLQKQDLSFSLLQYFDADLRISTDSITMRQFETGPGAITVSLNSSILHTDIAELALCGGTASGKVRLNSAEDLAKLQIYSQLNQINTGVCLQGFTAQPPLQGIADIQLKAFTKGRRMADFIEALNGDISLNIAQTGRMKLALGNMFGAQNAATFEGWPHITSTYQNFSSLRASMKIVNGLGLVRNFALQAAPDKTYFGVGRTYFSKGQIDYKIVKRSPLTQAASFQPSQNAITGLSIQGHWDNPRISLHDSQNISSKQEKQSLP